MTLRDDRKAEADGIWPPAVQHPTGSVPAISPDVKRRELRVGRIALLSAVTGIGIPALAMGVLMLLLRPVSSATLRIDNILLDAWLITCLVGVACEVTAVAAGIVARGTRAGRWGMAIPMFALAVSLVLVLIQHHMNGTWPWEGLGDPCGCDGSG